MREHRGARDEAEFIECIQRFDIKDSWEMYDYLFTNQTNPQILVNAFHTIRDRPVFLTVKRCFDSRALSALVDADIEIGREYGVAGTPTSFMNGERLVGSINRTSLENLIAKKSTE